MFTVAVLAGELPALPSASVAWAVRLTDSLLIVSLVVSQLIVYGAEVAVPIRVEFA